jgi:hypothetical protein
VIDHTSNITAPMGRLAQLQRGQSLAPVPSMSSLSAKAKPEYAARGIATFPFRSDVEGKHPLTRGYHRVGISGSAQLAIKIPDAPGIACMAGQGLVKLTLVDIDARGSEADRLLGDVQNQFGPPKVVVRTGRGGLHAYYRHNGEGRKIRPDPNRPIDILGGGVVVLPPSQGVSQDYKFIEGTIDDLPNLTVMRGGIVAPPIVPSSMPPGLPDLPVTEGRRDATIWPYIARQAHHATSLEHLIAMARELNDLFVPPETDAIIVKKCKHWWDKTQRGENRFGVGKIVIMDHDLIDGLMVRSADSYILLSVLKRHHWGRDFYFANAMRQIMPEGGWPLRRFTAARKILIDEGMVTIIRDATRREPMLCRLSRKQ